MTYYLRNAISIRKSDDDNSDDEFFRFEAVISNTNLDTYYTRMDKETTLKNYVEDAKRSVMLLDSHQYTKLGYGQSIDARFEGDDVVATFEVPKGITYGGTLTFATTDDFIRAVRTSLLRDMSVGFNGGIQECNICGGDMHRYSECPHWPGEVYEIDKKDVMAEGLIKDANLSEVSAVFDGATPGAEILRKVHELQSRNALSSKSLSELPYRFNIEFDDNKRIFIPSDFKYRKNTTGEEPEDINMEANEIRELVTEVVSELLKPMSEGITRNAETLDKLSKQVDTSERSKAEKEANEEYIRAFGDEGNVEQNKTFLSNLENIEDVRASQEQWKSIADAKFQSGRSTQDNDDDNDDEKAKNRLINA